MNTEISKDERRKATERYLVHLVVAALSVGVISGLASGVMKFWDVPTWGRALLSLSPLLPMLILLKRPAAVARPDELAVRIGREAAVLAFYGLFMVVVVADLLLKGRVLTEFTWNRTSLVITMGVLLVLGHAWTARRYR